MSVNERGFLDKVWDFLCSLKLTLFLLITLAATSIIGTVIPQYPGIDPRYWATISASRKLLYEKLGFFEMYHSWWFLALLALFSINLIACSIKRLPHVFKFISEPATVLGETQQKIFQSRDFKLTSSLEDSRQKLEAFLKEHFAAPVVTKVDNGYHLFSQKNPWCRLGVYLVHLSVLVIFAGAIIGTLFGYKATVSIVEGGTVNEVEGRNGKPIPLGFEVKCDQFTVSFYEGKGGMRMPKEFKSILTFTENGKEIPGYKHARLVVNDPITYKGITFYQSNYGEAGDPQSFFFSVRNRETGKVENITLKPGHITTLSDNIKKVAIVDLTNNQGEGLAAVLAVSSGTGEPSYFKVFRDAKDMDELRGDRLIFNFTGTDARMFTGLQAVKDPGVWVVWAGCTFMCIGLCIAFFMSHKRVWIVLHHGYARLYGNASKNQPGFQNEFDSLADKLKGQNI